MVPIPLSASTLNAFRCDSPFHQMQVPLGNLLWQPHLPSQQLAFKVLKRCRLAFLSHRIPHGRVDGSGKDTVDSGRSEVDGEASGDALCCAGGMVSACACGRVWGGQGCLLRRIRPFQLQRPSPWEACRRRYPDSREISSTHMSGLPIDCITYRGNGDASIPASIFHLGMRKLDDPKSSPEPDLERLPTWIRHSMTLINELDLLPCNHRY